MLRLLQLILIIFIAFPAYADTIQLLDEGSNLGHPYKLDCVGAGVTCTRSGGTGTLTISGGAGGGGALGDLSDVGSSTATQGAVLSADGTDWESVNAGLNMTGTRNVGLGVNAGSFTDNGQSDSVYIGEEAGSAITSGTRNTFVGAFSGDGVTSGNANVVVGYFAGDTLTTGSANTLVGNEAGQTLGAGINNVFLGFQAGETATGENNVAVGYEAGDQMTGDNNVAIGITAGGAAGFTSDYNVFVGYFSGAGNTTGAFNTFIGAESGQVNTTGSRNVMLGYQAGENFTADDSVFIGYVAGDDATGTDNTIIGALSGDAVGNTGTNNTFLGYATGTQNTTASNNTFLGYRSGASATTGQLNTCVGAEACDANITGQKNICIGSDACGGDTDGSQNIMIGESSGRLGAGDNNVFIGQNAGLNATAGTNTFIGASSGVDVSTGAGNVFIGNSVGFSNLDGSNQLAIDNSDTATPLLLGDFSGNTLDINGGLNVKNGSTSAGVLAIFEDSDDGSNNATFTVPALAADTDYTLPPNDGGASQFLQTDGSGVLTWEDGSATTEYAVSLPALDWSVAATTGDGKYYFVVPSTINNYDLTNIEAMVITTGTTGTLNVDLARCDVTATGNPCSGTVGDMLSTNLTIDSGEAYSSTAAAAAVIDTSVDDVQTDEVVRIDIDGIHSGTASNGLVVTLKFEAP